MTMTDLPTADLLTSYSCGLKKQVNGQTLTVTVGNNELAGTLTKITCSNGMLYDIPDSNLIGNVMYQLQITADYKIESEEF